MKSSSVDNAWNVLQLEGIGSDSVETRSDSGWTARDRGEKHKKSKKTQKNDDSTQGGGDSSPPPHGGWVPMLYTSPRCVATGGETDSSHLVFFFVPESSIHTHQQGFAMWRGNWKVVLRTEKEGMKLVGRTDGDANNALVSVSTELGCPMGHGGH